MTSDRQRTTADTRSSADEERRQRRQDAKEENHIEDQPPQSVTDSEENIDSSTVTTATDEPEVPNLSNPVAPQPDNVATSFEGEREHATVDPANVSASDSPTIGAEAVTAGTDTERRTQLLTPLIVCETPRPQTKTSSLDTTSPDGEEQVSIVKTAVTPAPPLRPNPLATTTPSTDRHRSRRRHAATHPIPDTMTEDSEQPTQSALSTTTPQADGATAVPADGGTSSADGHPDPLTHLLGVNGLHEPSHEPLVICVDAAVSHEYLGIIETLAKRLYRERVGGTPTPLRITDLEELCNEDRWIDVEGTITTIALPEADWDRLETTEDQSWERIWVNRIQNQLFAEEFGVLILNRRVLSPPGDHFPRIYSLNPAVPPHSDQHELGRLASGFSRGTPPSASTETFAQRFNIWQEREQRKAWRRVETDRDGLFWDATVPDEESMLHRRLKSFALRALAEAIDDEWQATDPVTDLQQLVSTEHPLQTNADQNESIRADVYCQALPNDGTVAIEAETLFGTDRRGGSPRDSLRQTIHKYDEVTVDHLVILIDPLTILTQGRTLASVRRRTKAADRGPTTTFATIDFTTGQLRTVRSVLRAWLAVFEDSDATSDDTWITSSDETPSFVIDR